MEIDQYIYNFRQELEVLGYSKETAKGYPRFIKHFLLFIGEIPTEITAEHIKNYHDYLQERPNKIRKGKLSALSILGELKVLKIYFDYLLRTGQIGKTPYILKLKTPPYKARTVLSPQEIETLYSHCQTREETILLHLAYGCGLRRSEIQNLNINDIDFEKRLLYIREGKGKKRRVVPLTEKITGDLKSYLESRKGGVGEAFLRNAKGERMRTHSLHHLFKKLLKRTGELPAISLHHLRHSIATHLLQNDMSIEMIRDFLGHNQLNTTQIYTRVNPLK